MRSDDPRHPKPTPPRRPSGPADWLFRGAMTILGVALFGLLMSLVIEYVGLLFFWPEEGAQHSYRMLQQELAYLERDFKDSILSSTPVDVALTSSAAVYKYSGMEALLRLLTGPVMVSDAEWAGTLRRGVTPFANFIEATAYITQLYGVRMAVVALSMPAFLIFAVVALIDGLVQRDLRRFGGGTESAFIYHHLKRVITPIIWLAVIFYLSTPFSLHPNVVFLPAAALFALILSKTAARFKKNL